jgi:hypothetical protein
MLQFGQLPASNGSWPGQRRTSRSAFLATALTDLTRDLTTTQRSTTRWILDLSPSLLGACARRDARACTGCWPSGFRAPGCGHCAAQRGACIRAPEASSLRSEAGVSALWVHLNWPRRDNDVGRLCERSTAVRPGIAGARPDWDLAPAVDDLGEPADGRRGSAPTVVEIVQLDGVEWTSDALALMAFR